MSAAVCALAAAETRASPRLDKTTSRIFIAPYSHWFCSFDGAGRCPPPLSAPTAVRCDSDGLAGDVCSANFNDVAQAVESMRWRIQVVMRGARSMSSRMTNPPLLERKQHQGEDYRCQLRRAQRCYCTRCLNVSRP